jgi:tetratricopeptide (TPR) repeat protein
MILRKLGKYQDALDQTKIVEQLNQLSFNNMFEQYLLVLALNDTKKDELLDLFIDKMRYDHDNYLEVASRYGEAGFLIDAIELLKIAEKSGDGSFKIASTPYSAVLSDNILIYYYLAYYNQLNGDSKARKHYYKKASNKSTTFCFPYGASTLDVLDAAVKANENDAKANYLLGNLLCDFQPLAAEKYWNKSAELNPKSAITYRNLAFVQGQIFNNLEDAITNIKTAIKLNPDDASYYADADEYLKATNASVLEREDIYRGKLDVLRTSDRAFTAYLQMSNMNGNYDLVIDEMSKHRFRVLENVKRIHHQYWAVAHIMKGRENYAAKNYKKAIFHFNEALRFPRNLELMRDGKEKEAYFYLAQTYEAMQEDGKAIENYKKLLEIAPVDAANSWGAQDWIEIAYYKYLAAKKLGMDNLAADIHVSLWDKSKSYFNKSYHSTWDWRSVRQRFTLQEDEAYGYFSLGLFYYTSNEYTKAVENFKKTLEILPAYFSAKDFLEMAEKNQKENDKL